MGYITILIFLCRDPCGFSKTFVYDCVGNLIFWCCLLRRSVQTWACDLPSDTISCQNNASELPSDTISRFLDMSVPKQPLLKLKSAKYISVYMHVCAVPCIPLTPVWMSLTVSNEYLCLRTSAVLSIDRTGFLSDSRFEVVTKTCRNELIVQYTSHCPKKSE